MTMTPEEKAVVQAAINDQDLSPGLRDSVRRLIYSCVECNTDTHRCGGCGENTQHGDNDCGKNCTDTSIVDELIWVLRTWEDVRPGDHVRIETRDAYDRPTGAYVDGVVASAVRAGPEWHVKPGTGDKPWSPPVALDWYAISVQFEGDPTMRDMMSAKPVEIEMTRAELAAVELLGWENRIRGIGVRSA